MHDLQHIRSRAGRFVPYDKASRAGPGPFIPVAEATERALSVCEHSRKADHWAGEKRHFAQLLVKMEDLPSIGTSAMQTQHRLTVHTGWPTFPERELCHVEGDRSPRRGRDDASRPYAF